MQLKEDLLSQVLGAVPVMEEVVRNAEHHRLVSADDLSEVDLVHRPDSCSGACHLTC
jgi:hypothetical protein